MCSIKKILSTHRPLGRGGGLGIYVQVSFDYDARYQKKIELAIQLEMGE
jgi:hypothetical protein